MLGTGRNLLCSAGISLMDASGITLTEGRPSRWCGGGIDAECPSRCGDDDRKWVSIGRGLERCLTRGGGGGWWG